MSIAEETANHWGATVADVRALLRHVDLAPSAGSSNTRYTQARTSPITDATITTYLDMVAADVSARVLRYEQVPERTRAHVRTMARTLVANGAAYYTQAAAFPASADPNNGSPYVADLRARFQTGLDRVAVITDDEAEKADVASSGYVAHNFPGTWFSDEVVW